MLWKLINKGIDTLTGRIIIKIKLERKMRETNRKLGSLGYKQKDQQSQQEARNRARSSDGFKMLVQNSWASPSLVQTGYGSFMLLSLCAKHV